MKGLTEFSLGVRLLPDVHSFEFILLFEVNQRHNKVNFVGLIDNLNELFEEFNDLHQLDLSGEVLSVEDHVPEEELFNLGVVYWH
jgi:hypothetical protein